MEKKDYLNYSYVKIGIASSDKIRKWSYGEVVKPETLNYRTLRPEKDGLFCERIFGTTKDWECFCGKFKNIRYKGVVCDRCGVEVMHSSVRRQRMGHIDLAASVIHIWFYRSVPSRVGVFLNMSIISIKEIVYFNKYVVIDPGIVPGIKKNDLLTTSEYYDLKEEYANAFKAKIGAEAIKELLMTLNIEEEIEKMRDKVVNVENVNSRRLVRYSLLEDFLKSENKPEWMVMDVIPVIPPDLRPMVQLDGGRFATSDLNDLYRRLINRNNRLKKLLVLKAPEMIVKNEKRMLQEAVDALFDNARNKKSVRGMGNRQLKSLSDVLKGKQGRFRQNLLGKRVDYSGRSVIVVGPELKLHQCGIPKRMAVELFKPFIIRKLVLQRLVYNIKSAKKLVESSHPEVWKILEDVVKEYPVLLNRAPTLHRLGIQAFELVLTDYKAVRLHPLVCASYNADFDGDQVAVHIPLAPEAQIEAWTLMLSAFNLLDPANGHAIVTPSQDIVLGLYNLTVLRKGKKGEGKRFSSRNELILAFENGCVDIQAEILLRENGKIIKTTVGRVIFSDAFPDKKIVETVMDEKLLKKAVEGVLETYGNYKTVVFLDAIKELGFKYSTYFGSTVSVGDMLIPEEKEAIVESSRKKVLDNNNQYQQGLITNEERYQKNIALWALANDEITDKMMDKIESDRNGENDLYIMATSGARGSRQQIRQLSGMRGLMAKPSGDILEMPIVSNFKEGLSVFEYFISTHGSRKGLSDTALKTADAGYLTRKLVDISQDVVVEIEDCNTINGIYVSPIKNGDQIVEKISDRVSGRFTAEKIINPYTDETILNENEYIGNEIARTFDDLFIENIKIRSAMTCDSLRGICQKCYGRNLANNRLVDIGEPVGIVASQSIGQPGTQLTMRTFHIGGTASSEVADPSFKFLKDTIILKVPKNVILNQDKKVVFSRRGFIEVATIIEDYSLKDIKDLKVEHEQRLKAGDVLGYIDGKEIKAKTMSFVYINKKKSRLVCRSNLYQLPVKIGAIFEKEVGEVIRANDIVYNYDSINEPIISEISGVVRYQDIIVNKTIREETDELSGIVNKKVIESKENILQPKIVVVSKNAESMSFDLPVDSILRVKDGEEVKVGNILAIKIRMEKKTSDITGGLPRVQELFEARNPSNPTVIAEIDGFVEIGSTVRGKREVIVTNEYDHAVKHVIPSGKALFVRSGDEVKAGEFLCEGNPNPHDILKIQGEVILYSFILDGIQGIYKQQGVEIKDKHIEVIVRQMLRKVEIIDSGDSVYTRGELVDKYSLREENRKVIEEGGRSAVSRSVLLGLTKAALKTESFISSASFQETTKVLADAAIKNKIDELRGLKENVIIGNKIPAGTGKSNYKDIIVYKNTVGDLDFIGEEDHDVQKVNDIEK